MPRDGNAGSYGNFIFSFLRNYILHAAAAKSLQSCLTLRPHRRQPTRLPHPWDSPGKNTGVGYHFLLQCVKVKSLSRVRLFETPWTAAYQAPLSMGFSRQEYWSGVLSPSPSFSPGRPFNKLVVFNCICKKNWFCSFQEKNFTLTSFLQSLKSITAILCQKVIFPLLSHSFIAKIQTK